MVKKAVERMKAQMGNQIRGIKDIDGFHFNYQQALLVIVETYRKLIKKTKKIFRCLARPEINIRLDALEDYYIKSICNTRWVDRSNLFISLYKEFLYDNIKESELKIALEKNKEVKIPILDYKTGKFNDIERDGIFHACFLENILKGQDKKQNEIVQRTNQTENYFTVPNEFKNIYSSYHQIFEENIHAIDFFTSVFKKMDRPELAKHLEKPLLNNQNIYEVLIGLFETSFDNNDWRTFSNIILVYDPFTPQKSVDDLFFKNP